MVDFFIGMTRIERMLSMNDLEHGSFVIIENDPYEILEVAHLHMGRGSGSVQTKIKNLRTGQVYSRNYKPADAFEEADIEKIPMKFLYNHRGEFWFSDPKNPKDRFSLKEELIGEPARFLKSNLEVIALQFSIAGAESKIINIILPIKVDLKVVEAPPAVRGNTAQGGTKTVKLESGAEIQTPLFINEGDVVRVNTETGEYVERIEKSATN